MRARGGEVSGLHEARRECSHSTAGATSMSVTLREGRHGGGKPVEGVLIQ